MFKKRLFTSIIVISIIFATLSFILPQNVYAATIFSDTYETADYSAWTGTIENTNSTMDISSSISYESTYSAVCSLTSVWNTYAFAYYNLSAESTLYHREYIQVSGLPNSGVGTDLFGIMDNPRTSHLGTVAIDNNGSDYRWILKYYNNTVKDNLEYSTAVELKQGTWYYIEIMVKSGNGTGQVNVWIAENGTYIDESSPTIELNNIINNDLLIQTVFFGGFVTGGAYPQNIYSDNVVASTTWIGPTDYQKPTIGDISASNTVIGQEVQVSSSIADNLGIDFVIPSWNNTGTWQNQTTIDALDSNNFEAAFTGTWTNTAGTIVSIIFYANDTSNNWAASNQVDITLTEPAPTPTPTPSPTPTSTPTPSPTPTSTPTPSPTPTSTPTPSPEPVPGLPTEAIIGIAVIIILVVAIIVLRILTRKA